MRLNPRCPQLQQKRARPLASGRTDIKDFGKEGAEDALQYALADAIKDGAITGLRASTQALLSMGDDLEAQLAKALKFENVFKELEAMTHPVTAAVNDLNLQMKSLGKIFNEAGASSEEYAKLEELRQLKLKAILDEQIGGFNDTLKQLNGTDAGRSPLAVLRDEMAELDKYRATLQSGGTVDKDAFNSLVQEILGDASNVYGTQTAAFQSIRSDLINLTNSAVANATSEFNRASAAGDTYTAITDQTTQTVDAINTTNDILGRIEQALANGLTVRNQIVTAVNGVLIGGN